MVTNMHSRNLQVAKYLHLSSGTLHFFFFFELFKKQENNENIVIL